MSCCRTLGNNITCQKETYFFVAMTSDVERFLQLTLLFEVSVFMLEVATASSCHWKLHGRIRGYSKENPINQYDRAVIFPYVRTSRKCHNFSKTLKECLCYITCNILEKLSPRKGVGSRGSFRNNVEKSIFGRSFRSYVNTVLVDTIALSKI
jgi:hypothetical protein